MPRIRCRYVDCVFLEDGFCGAAAVEVDPDEGCLTYSHIEDVQADDSWDEEEIDEIWEEEEEDLYEEEDDSDDFEDEEE
jgi:hypothetical protein